MCKPAGIVPADKRIKVLILFEHYIDLICHTLWSERGSNPHGVTPGGF